MVRKSNQIRPRREIVERLGREVTAAQEATDEFDEAAARVLGLNRTDMRALSALARDALTPSDLARAAGLTRGATTTVVDRLEDAGYVRRVRNLEDRRGVRVEITDRTRREIGRIWGPLVHEGQKLIAKYSTSELACICEFLEESRAIQKSHAERIRNMAEHGHVDERKPTRRVT
jgi:DNA-binding MarR family transcriptional regulator